MPREEFLKMLLLSTKVNLAPWSGPKRRPLASDLPSAGAWDDPYLRAALALGITEADAQGRLQPTLPLTRADIAELLFRFDHAEKKNHVQALVTASEREIAGYFAAVGKKKNSEAAFAASRLSVLSDALTLADTRSDVVRGTASVSQALTALSDAWTAARDGKKEELQIALGVVRAITPQFPSNPAFDTIALNIVKIAQAIEMQSVSRK